MYISEEYVIKAELKELNEGFMDIIRAIRGFFEFGDPKSLKFRTIKADYTLNIRACKKAYPLQAGGSMSINVATGDPSGGATLADNPNLTLCLLKSQLVYYEKLVKILEVSDPEEMCGNNLNKNRCISWIAKKLPKFKQELKKLQQSLGRLDMIMNR